MKKDIYVIGHKNPDTDSICSAISYANLKNAVTNSDHYKAMRAGEINPETAFVLDYFGVEAPGVIGDVRAQIKDADFAEGITINKDLSIRKAWDTLLEEKVPTLTVVDEHNKVIGIISVGDIAKSFMGANDNRVLAAAGTPYKNMIETIDGEILSGDKEKLIQDGKVIVATACTDYLNGIIDSGDIVILADKTLAQKCAIDNGAACIIICLGVEVDPSVIERAKEHGTVVIRSNHDSYVTARLLNQSIPVEYFMKKGQVIQFNENEQIEDVREIVADTRHRQFPIVNDEGEFVGILSRDNLLDVEKKQVILVDHNEKAQAVRGVASAEIVELVDHHKIGNVQTMSPVFYRNMPVGSTATIVYTMYREHEVEISREMAGMMVSAILSDTLIFKSPTCTPIDKKAAEHLAEIAGIDIEAFAMDMFAAGSDFGSKTVEEIFNLDYKKFTAGDTSYGVGQVSSVSKKELEALKEDLIKHMEDVVRVGDVDMVFLMLTDILEESSDFLCVGDRALHTAERAFGVKGEGSSVYLEGAVSRKKQIIPQMTAVLSV
ncbi:MAG: putative manganese-dependent inorganic diphosphatase [Eubacterium sp.]|nr:putative manganese-dependent inorganic diphosphatase [Eubacterium sp.]